MTIEHELIQVNGVGDATLNKLVAGGIETVVQLAGADAKDVMTMGLTGAQAGKIIAEANKLLEEMSPEFTPDEIGLSMEEIGEKEPPVYEEPEKVEKPQPPPEDKVAPSSTPIRNLSYIRMTSRRHRHRKR